MGEFYFGTIDRMMWFPAPKSGADMSPAAWEAGGVFLNGGAFQRHSWGSHKTYGFEWGESSSRQVAQIMKSYRDGTYGRGLIYFLNPHSYDLNVLPARWADPSMTLGFEGGSLVYGVDAEGPATSGDTNALPITSAYYDLSSIDVGWRGEREGVFIPIPSGYTLHLGAFHSVTGSGAIFITPVNTNGSLGTEVALTPVANNASEILPDSIYGVRGVYLWIGKSAIGAASVTVAGMVARLAAPGETVSTVGPWSGGMGHSGCRFAGPPTYVPYSGVNGGQVGFAASFTEVGDWL